VNFVTGVSTIFSAPSELRPCKILGLYIVNYHVNAFLRSRNSASVKYLDCIFWTITYMSNELFTEQQTTRQMK